MFLEVSATLCDMAKMSAEEKRRAADYALRVMRDRGLGDDSRQLALRAGVDPSTVRTFLDGETWPRTSSRQAIEKALGLERGMLTFAAREAMPTDRDPVKVAIEGSALTEANRLRLIATYLDMLDSQEGRGAG